MVNDLYNFILLDLTHLDILFSVPSGVALGWKAITFFRLFGCFEIFC